MQKAVKQPRTRFLAMRKGENNNNNVNQTCLLTLMDEVLT